MADKRQYEKSYYKGEYSTITRTFVAHISQKYGIA